MAFSIDGPPTRDCFVEDIILVKPAGSPGFAARNLFDGHHKKRRKSTSSNELAFVGRIRWLKAERLVN